MYATTMFNVEDVEASSRWYQRLLGCQSAHGGPDFEMLAGSQGVFLMLHRRSADHHLSSPAEGASLGAGVCLYIRVDDIKAVATRATELGLKHQGVRFNELAHQDELELRDPDGYYLTICGPAAWAPSPAAGG